jgi:chromosome segregation ATPase
MLPARGDRIDQIEHRIEELDQEASRLLERERRAAEQVLELQQRLDDVHSHVRAARGRRVLARRQRQLERLRTRRRDLVHEQIRGIMFALQDQAQRTRNELDRQLDRLAPIQEEWEHLRGTFGALESTIQGPAFASLAEQWQGPLEIPEFPLAQRSGYAKPFPQHALLF